MTESIETPVSTVVPVEENGPDLLAPSDPVSPVKKTLSVDAALEKEVELYFQLKPLASKFKKLKEKLKPLFEGTDSISVGRFIVTGSWKSQPEKIMRACRYWDIKVEQKVDFKVLAAAQEEGAS